MPQLDIVSFFSQVFWLLLCFFSFYVIFHFKVVPLIARILKMRIKKINKTKTFIDIFQAEQQNIFSSYDKIIVQSIQKSVFFSNKCNDLLSTWLNTNLFEINNKKAINNLFIKTFVNVFTAKLALHRIIKLFF